MRNKQPPKTVSADVERLRAENDVLRATNAQLKRALQMLSERQRDRAQKQAAFDEPSSRLTGDDTENSEKPRG